MELSGKFHPGPGGSHDTLWGGWRNYNFIQSLIPNTYDFFFFKGFLHLLTPLNWKGNPANGKYFQCFKPFFLWLKVLTKKSSEMRHPVHQDWRISVEISFLISQHRRMEIFFIQILLFLYLTQLSLSRRIIFPRSSLVTGSHLFMLLLFNFLPSLLYIKYAKRLHMLVLLEHDTWIFIFKGSWCNECYLVATMLCLVLPKFKLAKCCCSGEIEILFGSARKCKNI